MTLGERVNRILLDLLLLLEGGAIDPTRDVVSTGSGGHGSHKARSAPPGAFARFHDRPLVEQYAERFERLCIAAERDLEAVRQGVDTRPARDTRSKRKRDEDRAILREVGRDPTWVAFVYGRTTDSVQRLRKRHGLDPNTGERAPRPLTSRELLSESAPTTTKEDQP